MTGELFNDGLMLMLVGMGTVFAFLTLLVGATTLMSRVVERFAEVPVAAAPAAGAVTEDTEVAAVAAAVEHHRRKIRP
jgi:oxaloacetate decarboxylase gamma subunit